MCLVFFLFSKALRNALYKGVPINCADTDILRHVFTPFRENICNFVSSTYKPTAYLP